MKRESTLLHLALPARILHISLQIRKNVSPLSAWLPLQSIDKVPRHMDDKSQKNFSSATKWVWNLLSHPQKMCNRRYDTLPIAPSFVKKISLIGILRLRNNSRNSKTCKFYDSLGSSLDRNHVYCFDFGSSFSRTCHLGETQIVKNSKTKTRWQMKNFKLELKILSLLQEPKLFLFS